MYQRKEPGRLPPHFRGMAKAVDAAERPKSLRPRWGHIYEERSAVHIENWCGASP
jgi:hypothetical protein